jgi:hypothetical protein
MDMTYKEWTDFIFDHPAEADGWWWKEPEDDRMDFEDLFPQLALEYMTRLFEHPASLIDRFSHVQIDRGLAFLVSNSCSNYMFVITDADLPLADRVRCIAAMFPLYRDLMAPIYGNVLSAGSSTSDPLRPTFACYMWWDVIPLHGGMERPDIDEITEAVMEVFKQTLTLDAEAVLESALHGLGHWHLYVPSKTEPIVENFLIRRTEVSARLKGYAQAAARGDVL